jgi:hypothetical protein
VSPPAPEAAMLAVALVAPLDVQTQEDASSTQPKSAERPTFAESVPGLCNPSCLSASHSITEADGGLELILRTTGICIIGGC